jgi:hypothetical protein
MRFVELPTCLKTKYRKLPRLEPHRSSFECVLYLEVSGSVALQ